MPKGRRESQARISDSDLNWVKETLGRLLIENGTLRIVTAHLVAAKCKESNDPQLALRDLHGALDEAAKLVLQGDKPQSIQRVLEMYQPKIDEIIQAAGKLLSPPPQQS